MLNIFLWFFGIVGAIALICSLIFTFNLIMAFRHEDSERISKTVTKIVPSAMVTVFGGMGFGVCLLISLLL